MASIEQLLNIDPADIQKMNSKELRGVVQQLASAGNKRLARLEQSAIGAASPALQSVRESGRMRFSTKGKNLNQLRNEFKEATKFLKSKTSIIKGVENWKSKTEKAVGGDFSDGEFVEFGVIMGEIRKLIGRDGIKAYGSTEIARYIHREMPLWETTDEVVDSVMARINNRYEELMEEYADTWDDVGDFYEFDEDESEDLPF